MKLFVTALRVPAVYLCGAVVLMGYGVFERSLRLLDVPPPKPVLTGMTPAPLKLDHVVRVMARKHNVKEEFVKSIIAAESGFRQEAVSHAGAIGLMQLMPATARDLGVDPSVAEQNVEGGTKYLGWLLYRYRNNRDGLQRAIAAYNAGPGNVDKYRGIPPFQETRKYVTRVLTYYDKYEGRPAKRPVKRARSASEVEYAD
jgi:soluble lytic murein transglycosylase-like protein